MISSAKLFNELLPNQDHLKFQNCELEHDHHRIVFFGRSVQPTNACPLCRQSTRRVHSHYLRRLADLSWADYEIVLQVQVRKFFCDNASCQRRIFTERMSSVMAPWARRTQRLGKQLYEIALQLGGAAGARLSQQLFCDVSRNTLLRLLMKQPLPLDTTPTTPGVDDFAFRKRQSYGTILVDLEQRRPIALLLGRDGSRLTEWLKQHGGVQVLSRDRSQAYKSGMSQGAPDAIQVADRFHLIHNLAEVAIRSNHGVLMPKGQRVRYNRWRSYDQPLAHHPTQRRYIREIIFGTRRSVCYYQITKGSTDNPDKADSWFIMTNIGGNMILRVGNQYTLRTWIEYGFKQVKNELGWHDYRLTDYRSIERWWELIFSALLAGESACRTIEATGAI